MGLAFSLQVYKIKGVFPCSTGTLRRCPHSVSVTCSVPMSHRTCVGSCSISARSKQTLIGPAEFSVGAKGRFRFCLGGEGVWNILGFIPSPSVPPRDSSGHHGPKFLQFSSLAGIGVRPEQELIFSCPLSFTHPAPAPV